MPCPRLNRPVYPQIRSIASAVIATYGAQVVDTFYVKDMFGLKLHAKPKQEALEKKLRQAVTEGAARAAT